MSNVELSLLDRFELRCQGERCGLPLASQRVVAFLALHRGSLSRSHVARRLWFRRIDHGQASLRSCLWRVRACCPLPIIACSRTHIELVQDVGIDVEDQIAAARRTMDPGTPLAEIGEEHLSGDLLPDWCDAWVLSERERLRQLRMHALETLAIRLAEEERFGEAVDAAWSIIRTDELRESAHRVLIRVYVLEGNRVEAARHMERCRSIFMNQLGSSFWADFGSFLSESETPFTHW